MIAALFVIKDGIYFNEDGIDPWDEEKDARKYRGPHKVIAHPPCQRWGRYWGGGPMLHGTSSQKLLGDDDGCFAHALWSVRTFGGLLEHPEASHAFHYYGLPIPSRWGTWSERDKYGGRSCCIAQGHYGHPSQKLTWLYSVGCSLPELKWGPCGNKIRLDRGAHSTTERKLSRAENFNRTTTKQNLETPVKFRDLLIMIVSKT